MRPPSAQLWAMACQFFVLSYMKRGQQNVQMWPFYGNNQAGGCRQRGLSKEDHLVLQELKAAGNKGASKAEHA